MKQTLFAAAMAIFMAFTATTSVEAYDGGKQKKHKRKGTYSRNDDRGYTYRNGSYYDRDGRYIGTQRPVMTGGIFGQRRPVYNDDRRYPIYENNRRRKAHPVHGPGWVPPGQRKKMQRNYDRW